MLLAVYCFKVHYDDPFIYIMIFVYVITFVITILFSSYPRLRLWLLTAVAMNFDVL